MEVTMNKLEQREREREKNVCACVPVCLRRGEEIVPKEQFIEKFETTLLNLQFLVHGGEVLKLEPGS